MGFLQFIKAKICPAVEAVDEQVVHTTKSDDAPENLEPDSN
jgi:hypothetical protein